MGNARSVQAPAGPFDFSSDFPALCISDLDLTALSCSYSSLGGSDECPLRLDGRFVDRLFSGVSLSLRVALCSSLLRAGSLHGGALEH